MAKAVKATSISIDIGIEEIDVNGRHVLRINPSDINLGSRFQSFIDEIPALMKIDEELEDTAKMEAMYQADQSIKAKLGEVFPWGNDFDVILDRVNVISPTESGTTVIENFMTAITPVIEQFVGTRMKTMQEVAKDAAAKAAANREQRRAVK